jgi:DNA-binding MarR family transcriptional regulator
VRITLTARGEQVFRDAARVHLAGIRERVTRHLTDDEARTIADALERVRIANTDTPPT